MHCTVAHGAERAWLKDSGRAEYVIATDEEALKGFRLCHRSRLNLLSRSKVATDKPLIRIALESSPCHRECTCTSFLTSEVYASKTSVHLGEVIKM
ncbi:hypothetical protein L210DRAFT_3557277 [Boletus edulis BED1]|uniref:Uncharacterized protein n=1 Tax=Boletus edulis BED1 TaxID=1328754 RepID=A0AAD4GA14_BOLED|nr:hypothetical protein L210DRAFT_3557277 [Boletus edulis BED1]